MTSIHLRKKSKAVTPRALKQEKEDIETHRWSNYNETQFVKPVLNDLDYYCHFENNFVSLQTFSIS